MSVFSKCVVFDCTLIYTFSFGLLFSSRLFETASSSSLDSRAEGALKRKKKAGRERGIVFVAVKDAFMTLKMASAQFVETSIIVDNNSSFQNYTNPDDHTQQTQV